MGITANVFICKKTKTKSEFGLLSCRPKIIVGIGCSGFFYNLRVENIKKQTIENIYLYTGVKLCPTIISRMI